MLLTFCETRVLKVTEGVMVLLNQHQDQSRGLGLGRGFPREYYRLSYEKFG